MKDDTDAGEQLLCLELVYMGKPLGEPELEILNHRDPFASDGARNKLRLALTRQLSDSLKGRLQACNQPDGSTRMIVRLPYQPIEREVKPQLPESLVGKRLLVVDNDPDFCQILQEHAKRWGMQCLVALDEPQALAIVRNQLLLHSPIESLVVNNQLNAGSATRFLTRIRKELADNGLPPPICVLLSDEASTPPAHSEIFDVLAKHNCAYLLRSVLERAYSPQAGH